MPRLDEADEMGEESCQGAEYECKEVDKDDESPPKPYVKCSRGIGKSTSKIRMRITDGDSYSICHQNQYSSRTKGTAVTGEAESSNQPTASCDELWRDREGFHMPPGSGRLSMSISHPPSRRWGWHSKRSSGLALKGWTKGRYTFEDQWTNCRGLYI